MLVIKNSNFAPTLLHLDGSFFNIYFFLIILLLTSCGNNTEQSKSSSDAMDRMLLGLPADYPAHFDLKNHEDKLKKDEAHLRKLAWEIIEKIWTPHNISTHPVRSVEIPAWRSWYDLSDLKRIFLYALKNRSNKTTPSISYPDIQSAETWNTTMIRSLSHFSQQAQDQRIADFAESKEVLNSAGGFARVLYSPDMLRDMILNYSAIADCFSADNFILDSQAPCLDRGFTSAAVSIKALWKPSHEKMPVFDTSTDAIKNILSGQIKTWKHTELADRPAQYKIFRAVNTTGKELDLRAMHIVTKELPHWIWITLWWSPDPDSDFGSDRPTSLQNTILKNYKMCAVVDFKDGSAQNPSWCSNPYIETGDDLANTNCIGCHQFASPLRRELSKTEETELNKTLNHNHYDYVWSLSSEPENIAAFLHYSALAHPSRPVN